MSTKCHVQTLHPDMDKLAMKRLLRSLWKCEHGLGAGQYQGVSVHFVWCGMALWLCVFYRSKLNTHEERTWHLGPSREKGRETGVAKPWKLLNTEDENIGALHRILPTFVFIFEIFTQKFSFGECLKAKQKFLEREGFLFPSLDPHIVTPIIITASLGFPDLSKKTDKTCSWREKLNLERH